MAVPAGKAPIVESVRAALAAWRATAPQLWFASVLGGCAIVGITLFLGAGAGLFGIFLLTRVVVCMVYAMQLRAALGMGDAQPFRLMDGLRVFGAMTLVGAFLFIVFLVASLPGSAILTAAAGIDEATLQATSQNPEAFMAMLERIIATQPAVCAALALVYGAVWMLLSSRLYMAAPATVAEGAIRTFETWRWTEGNALRISAARLILVVPMFALFLYAPYPLGAAVEGAGDAVQIGAAIALQSAGLFIAWGLEACLSAYLYKGLKPSATPHGPSR